MPKPVIGPAAWIGDELLERDDWTLTLAPQAIHRHRRALGYMGPADGDASLTSTS